MRANFLVFCILAQYYLIFHFINPPPKTMMIGGMLAALLGIAICYGYGLP
jgi:hypothetical protein